MLTKPGTAGEARVVKLPLAWQFIDHVRAAVAEALATHSEELREAATMAASELAENVVKYGQSMHGEDSGKISISVDAGGVRIVSESGASAAQAERVNALITQLSTTKDVAALFVARLAEMSRLPGDSPTELGLLRIAFEGGFSLRCQFDDGRLQIEAHRPLQ